MNEKQYRDFIKYSFIQLQEKMGLKHWRIQVQIVDEIKSYDENIIINAQTRINTDYLSVEIKIRDDLHLDYSEDLLLLIFCHELCHIYVKPLSTQALINANPTRKSFIRSIEEQAVEAISRAICQNFDSDVSDVFVGHHKEKI
jgi:uncharacterized protein (UPF0371 family)